MATCTGFTSNDTSCRNNAVKGEAFCHLHLPGSRVARWFRKHWLAILGLTIGVAGLILPLMLVQTPSPRMSATSSDEHRRTAPVTLTTGTNSETVARNGTVAPTRTTSPDKRSPRLGDAVGDLSTIPPCAIRSVFDPQPGVKRSVLVVNGSIDDLLSRYFRDADERELNIGYDELTVHYYDSKAFQEVHGKRLTPDEVAADIGAAASWLQRVRGLRAFDVHDPIASATRLQADLVCGSLDDVGD